MRGQERVGAEIGETCGWWGRIDALKQRCVVCQIHRHLAFVCVLCISIRAQQEMDLMINGYMVVGRIERIY